VRDVVEKLSAAGMSDVPTAVSGIIPQEDVNILKQCAASAVYVPRDFHSNEIMMGIVNFVA
jgi:(2R)-ethylmalonyl-CoA mutase